jgi:hypothetical protein
MLAVMSRSLLRFIPTCRFIRYMYLQGNCASCENYTQSGASMLRLKLPKLKEVKLCTMHNRCIFPQHHHWSFTCVVPTVCERPMQTRR